MKLASYKGTRDGWMGIGNRLIRLRLRGDYSHCEIVFEPGDGVDHLMPDGTCEPVNGAYWCVSSTGLETIPEWSTRRAGKRGGVRFERIVLQPKKWTLDRTKASPLHAAQWANMNQGRLYDWQLVLGFLAWLIPHKASRVACHEACGEMLGIDEAWRLDPCSLQAVTRSAK